MSDSNLPKVGVGVLVVRDGMILLGKRCGLHMPGYYAAPGGHLESGESFAECARREVFEETGLRASSVAFLTVGNYRFDSKHYVDVDMLAECSIGEPVAMELDKCAGWDWYHRDSLPSPLFIVTRRMIEAYIRGCDVDAQAIEQILEQD